MLTEIDRWIGTTLFVPPVIKLCQLTRQSQYAIARLFWFIAALDAFYRADTLILSLVWGGLSLVMMLSAARRANHPVRSYVFFRMLAVVLLCFHLTTGVATGKSSSWEFWLFVVIAAYAATIRTIPPSVTPKRQARPSKA